MSVAPPADELLTERLRPQALMPEHVGLAHLLTALLCAVSAVGLFALALTNLPVGLVLLLAIAPTAAWAWLSVRAWRANATVAGLYRTGQVVRGRVTRIESTPDGARLHYRYRVLPDDRDALAALELDDEQALEPFTHEAHLEGISRLAAVRYHTGMQVGVIFEPDAPTRSALMPPPGGGTPLDLVGDVFAAVLRRVPDDTPDTHRTERP